MVMRILRGLCRVIISMIPGRVQYADYTYIEKKIYSKMYFYDNNNNNWITTIKYLQG